MFMQLRQAKHLKVSATSSEASVGFKGRTAHIARIHQLGQWGKVGNNGPLHHYPQRVLLGVSDDDRQWVQQQLHDLLTR